MVDAMDLASNHDLTIWDSVALAASAQAECRLLLSEDLQDGFTWRGVTVTNFCVETSSAAGDDADQSQRVSGAAADYFAAIDGAAIMPLDV